MTVASLEAANEGIDTSGDSDVSVTEERTAVSESDVILDHEAPPVNEEPWLRRFWKHKGLTKWRRRWRMLRRAWRFVMKFGDRSLSRDEHWWRLTHLREWDPDDLDDHRRQKDQARLAKFHADQAKILKPIIIETLVRLKFCTFQIRGEREYIKQRPRISRVDVSPYAYTFYISKVPFGVKSVDMATDEVATELSVSVRKKVRAELDPVNGLRYTVMIASTLSVPNFVSFDDVKSMPKNLPPLAFFVGLGPNGKPVYRDLAEAPHLLIGGGSGNGKSNAENMIACTLIARNSPNIVQLVFVDLKGGVEFGTYDGIPHLFKRVGVFEQAMKKKVQVPIERDEDDDDETKTRYETQTVDAVQRMDVECDGIIEFPEQALSAFRALSVECDERLARLKKAKVKNIAEFNRNKHEKNRMPYVVVFVDEWAVLKRLGGIEIEGMLERLANLSRATGIHFVLSAQNPKAEIINTAITVNFTWRLAFGMSTAASQAVLGNWNAFGLTPKGRCIFLSNDGEMEIQTPRITNSTISNILEEARTGVKSIQRVSIDIEEILEWALDNTEGRLTHPIIFEKFKERITDAALRDLLKSTENREFDIRGTLYRVKPGYGNFPRRMERVDDLAAINHAPYTQNGPETVTRDSKSVTEMDEPIYPSLPRRDEDDADT